MSYLFGVDVSHHNGAINWTKLKSSGHCSFAILKATDGTNVDPQFLTNLAACKALKIPYAFYVFAESNTVAGAQSEAKFVLSRISGSSPLFVAYDAECSALSSLNKSETTDVANAFLSIIKSSGYVPYLYCSKSWSNSEIDVQFLKNKGYGFWDAFYNGQTPSTSNYETLCDIWQYSESGVLDGNGSSCIDLDCIYSPSLISRIQSFIGVQVNPDYCDTRTLTVCPGTVYTFKTGSKPTCANNSFTQVAQVQQGGYYLTTFKAVALSAGVGFYANEKRICIATVKTPYCDTTQPFTKSIGQDYTFKTDFPLTCANKAIFQPQGTAIKNGNYYLTKFKAVGKGSAGFYCGSVRVCVGTVA